MQQPSAAPYNISKYRKLWRYSLNGSNGVMNALRYDLMTPFSAEIEVLIAHASSESITRKVRALGRLLEIDNDESVRALLQVLDETYTMLMFAKIVRYLHNKGALDGVLYLRGILETPLPADGTNFHLTALQALVPFLYDSDNEHAFLTLIDFIFCPETHTRSRSRITAASYLGKIGDERALYHLRWLILGTNDSHLRQSVMFAIAQSVNPRAHLLLLYLLEDLWRNSQGMNGTTFECANDLAFGISRLLEAGIAPPHLSRLVDWLCCWLYLLPPNMKDSSILRALERTSTPEAKRVIANWQVWLKQSEERKHHVPIFR
jgi:hypothetical protein